MVQGGEKKHPTVILNGVVKDWVGIGWIELRQAGPEDYANLPVVED